MGGGLWETTVKWVKKIPELRYLTWRDILRAINVYWVNDGPKLVLILIWLLGNAAVVLYAVIFYWLINTNPYVVLGWGVVLARASAAGIKLNCALILIPVLRNLLSWIRGTWVGNYLPVDKAIVFHRKMAWVIAFYTVVHMTAHFYNFMRIETYTPRSDIEDKLGIRLDNDGNPPTALQLGWLTIAGSTGHLAAFVMILMYSTAVESVRRPMFELFWYTHHLFVVFFVAICVHGAGHLIGAPDFWAWVLPASIIYLVERVIRLVRGYQATLLHLAIAHPSNVIELQMQKAKFKFKSGQYLFLNCPYIARHEWHPFTISAAPEEDFVSVHIRIVGDWTGKLSDLLNPEKKLGLVQNEISTAPNGAPILRIDGPFGAASEDIFKFEVVMLIGAGIGVTPFASILKTIRYRVEAQQATGQMDIPITKAYFYWVAREKNSFEWFLELLCVLEDSGVGDVLELNTYLTSLKAPPEGEGDEYGRDPITGLKSGAHYGRPDFDAIFQEKADAHPNERVGVFFCGPAVMSKLLYKQCRKYTKKTSTKFHYHKENF